jgi:hypothetical protein
MIDVVISSRVDDGEAAFYSTQFTVVSNGAETTKDNRFRPSPLPEFNDGLAHDYGNTRILRLFPPRKCVGNREGTFIQQGLIAIEK